MFAKTAIVALFAGFAAFLSAQALAAAGNRGQGVEDVQVGEKALQTRIALICNGPCGLEKRGDGMFFLRGVTSEMDLDLSSRSRNINGFSLVPDAEGSLLHVSSRRILEYANTKACTISGRPATCVDLFYADAQSRPAALATPSLAPDGLAKAERAQNAPAPKKTMIAKPSLRESEPERLSRFSALAPPERLAPPQPARLASVRPAGVRSVQNQPSPSRPVIRDNRPLPATPKPEPFNYAAQIEALLGKKLTPGFCASARATLQSDPWALDAMVDKGLCAAAAGKAQEADATLARLLEYTPDNYEAYVGRALIAVQAGEKSIARRYFQNALDAPPPMEESSRIVAAMRAL